MFGKSCRNNFFFFFVFKEKGGEGEEGSPAAQIGIFQNFNNIVLPFQVPQKLYYFKKMPHLKRIVSK
jgi:hypothetical protein